MGAIVAMHRRLAKTCGCLILGFLVLVPGVGLEAMAEDSAGTTGGQPAVSPSPVAEIPDKALEQAILKSLLHRPADKGPLTVADLSEVYVMRADKQGIENLKGLEHCIHLVELSLAGNRIKDLAPLATCTMLQTVDLSENQISDLSPLATLTQLQYLDLTQNQITNLVGLEKLHSLAFLGLDGNQITCLHEIADLVSLRTLRVARNRVDTTLPLTKLRGLQILDLSENVLDEVAGLSGMKDLRWTFLQGNKIQEIRELVTIAYDDSAKPRDMASFWNLDLRGNPLGELARSVHLPMLEAAGVRLKKD